MDQNVTSTQSLAEMVSENLIFLVHTHASTPVLWKNWPIQVGKWSRWLRQHRINDAKDIIRLDLAKPIHQGIGTTSDMSGLADLPFTMGINKHISCISVFK